MPKDYEVIVTYRKSSDRPTVRRTAEFDLSGEDLRSKARAAFEAGAKWAGEDRNDAIVRSIQVLTSDEQEGKSS